MSLAVGLLAEVFSVEFLRQIGLGWGSVVEGFIFLGLGIWVHKRQSVVGLALAVGLYALDMIVGIVTIASQPGTTSSGGGYIVKILFLVFMSRGFGAIRDLRREQSPVAMRVGPTAP